MSFRQIIINSCVKLEFKLGYLVCRGEKNIKVHISEISTLIVQSTAVALTASLLCELVKNNVKVIFCDEKCSPLSELLPYRGSYNGSKRIAAQIKWKEQTKGEIWKKIIKRKIIGQAEVLYSVGKNESAEKLLEYAEEVLYNDTTNREGHASKIYFVSLFGDDFVRGAQTKINGYLNYGYAILLSAFNRAICANGYLTQIGVWHKNEYNDFNLACDLMEPFRPYIDFTVLSLEKDDADFKKKLADSLNKKTTINGQETTMENAIRIYTLSAINALNADMPELINFPAKYEL